MLFEQAAVNTYKHTALASIFTSVKKIVFPVFYLFFSLLVASYIVKILSQTRDEKVIIKFYKSSRSWYESRNFLNRFNHYGMGEIQHILLKKLLTTSNEIYFWSSGMSHYQQTIRFQCWSRTRSWIQELLMEFLPLYDRAKCKTFVWSNSINNDYNAWGTSCLGTGLCLQVLLF